MAADLTFPYGKTTISLRSQFKPSTRCCLMPDISDIHATDDFLKAAATGNLEGVFKARAAGAVVNRSDKSGQTALLHAAAQGHLDMLSFLFSTGADPRAQDSNGDDALMKSINAGHEAAARLCLRQNFNMSAANADGMTSFAIAARQGMSGLLDDMLAQGANPGACSNDGRTPLIHAAVSGHAPGVEKIVSYRHVMVDAQDNDGQSALMHALMGGHRGIVAHLLREGARVDLSDNRGRDMMFFARQWKLEDEVREAFRKYDVTQITQGARHDITLMRPLKVQRRLH